MHLLSLISVKYMFFFIIFQKKDEFLTPFQIFQLFSAFKISEHSLMFIENLWNSLIFVFFKKPFPPTQLHYLLLSTRVKFFYAKICFRITPSQRSVVPFADVLEHTSPKYYNIEKITSKIK